MRLGGVMLPTQEKYRIHSTEKNKRGIGQPTTNTVTKPSANFTRD
jgi:hypothetical protein